VTFLSTKGMIFKL